MSTRVCFVYPWATFGGVERVLLNRALAFKHYLPDVKLDFFFLHDAGGLTALRAAINQFDLDENVFIIHSLDVNYDLVFLIDCPQVVDLCVKRNQRYVIECHTPYTENRYYLGNVNDTCERVITPSSTFSDLLRSEWPTLPVRISELRNFVPWDIAPKNFSNNNCLPAWTKKPILFFARLDSLKDPISLLDAFEKIERDRRGEFILLLCGPRSPEICLETEVFKRDLKGLSVVLPPIPFAGAGRLLNSVASAGGLFVSPSKGESFGLSAAEAISSLLPVVLSDIKAHMDLVAGYEKTFSYPLGNTDQLAEKIKFVFDEYHVGCAAVKIIRNKFSAFAFIEDWIQLFNELETS